MCEWKEEWREGRVMEWIVEKSRGGGEEKEGGMIREE